MVTRARNRGDASPDLFNGPAMDEPVPSEAPPAARPRPLLPSDLEASLQILSAAEFERLFTAVNGEASRRRKSESTSRAHGPRPQKANPPAGIPSGKANAVRAAFKAGVKPSAIARQFGLSQADIRALLNSIDRR
jgi:hypothetical protein